MEAARRYFTDLARQFAAGWNRFWFTPRDTFSLSVLRIATGLVALYFVVSHTADLLRWFGPDGILAVERARPLEDEAVMRFRISYLYWFDSPSALWLAHAAGIAVVVAFVAGWLTRITSVASLFVVLSYVHRAPLLTAQFEPVLTMVLFYLCLAPCGRHLSLDRWLATRKKTQASERSRLTSKWDAKSFIATFVVRLMQVHITALYVMMAFSKLRGQGWWDGEAVWGLMANSESRLVDLTWLSEATYLINFWTHAIVVFELSFAVLIWNRLARPLMLGVAFVMWGSLALLSGLVAFCCMMLVANLAFVSSASLRRLCGPRLGCEANADIRAANDRATVPA